MSTDELDLSDASGVIEEAAGWLRDLIRGESSDLHLKVGSPPMVREQGRLKKMDREPMTPQEMSTLADALIPASRRQKFDDRGEVDFAHSAPGIGRFRVNAFRQRGSISIVMRKMGIGGLPFEELGLPDVCRDLADWPRGLVLITGPTGSGKTTTLAAMIEYINKNKALHIITIEDPIEVLHNDKHASINQREVGEDTENFLSALRVALRQDPDVILIGEMRDTETVRTALQAAETGHLVLSTLHTVDVTESVNRIVDFFPPHQQHQIRLTIAGALRGIISQRLVPAIPSGLVPATEVLINTGGRVAERIADPQLTAELHEIMGERSEYYGMHTFEQSLLFLAQTGKIEVDVAIRSSSHPHDLQLMLQQAGIIGAATTVTKA